MSSASPSEWSRSAHRLNWYWYVTAAGQIGFRWGVNGVSRGGAYSMNNVSFARVCRRSGQNTPVHSYVSIAVGFPEWCSAKRWRRMEYANES